MLAEPVDPAAEQGVTTLWLHVEVDNAPALALYESLGFTPHHSLAYQSPPDCSARLIHGGLTSTCRLSFRTACRGCGHSRSSSTPTILDTYIRRPYRCIRC